MITSLHRIGLFFLVATLVFASAAPSLLFARELQGRLFLGTYTQIWLEEDESFIQDFLRAINLVSSEAPKTNINSIAFRKDYLFIGEDRQVYLADPVHKEALYHIGSAEDLTDLKLFDGVVLEAVERATAPFEGTEEGAALKVTVPDHFRPVDEAPYRGRYAWWLTQLDEEYDSIEMSDLERRNYDAIMHAVTTALPDGYNDDPRAYEHVKLLQRHIRDEVFEDPEPMRELLSIMVERLTMDIKELENEGEDTQDIQDLLATFEDLQEELEKLAY